MNNFIRRYNSTNIIVAAIMLIAGIFIVINPKTIINIITIILGIGIGFFGICKLIRVIKNKHILTEYSLDFIIGIISTIIGIMLLIRPEIFTGILAMIIGFILIFQGAFKLQYALVLKKECINSKWKVLCCISIITLIAGITVIFFNEILINSIGIFIGVTLIIESIICIIEYISVINVLNEIEKLFKK